jgi:hypothetical protein
MHAFADSQALAGLDLLASLDNYLSRRIFVWSANKKAYLQEALREKWHGTRYKSHYLNNLCVFDVH